MNTASWLKLTLLALCILCCSTAFGQINGTILSSVPQPPSFYSNPLHAAPKTMASEETLLTDSTYSYARGERPLWEIPQAERESLGDAARRLRQEHASVKKSSVVYIN
jgi:hypothetical protein